VQKKEMLWIVNVVSFVLLLLLAVTGLVNWLLAPHGAGLSGGAGRALRHLLREFHAWTAVVFCLVCAIHIGLHWGTVRANLKRTGLLG
jgi:hypothetical protein